MIFGKFFSAIRAQLNKIANIFFEADPIAVMQLESTRRPGLEGGAQGTRDVSRSGRDWRAKWRWTDRLFYRSGGQGASQTGNRDVAGQLAVQLKTQNELGESKRSRCRSTSPEQPVEDQKANKDIIKVRDRSTVRRGSEDEAHLKPRSRSLRVVRPEHDD
jgi:hypothetical protein